MDSFVNIYNKLDLEKCTDYFCLKWEKKRKSFESICDTSIHGSRFQQGGDLTI